LIETKIRVREEDFHPNLSFIPLQLPCTIFRKKKGKGKKAKNRRGSENFKE
jgi:hypothetical protein